MSIFLALEHVHARRLSPPCRPRTVPQRCAPLCGGVRGGTSTPMEGMRLGFAAGAGGRHCLDPLDQNSWLHCYSRDRHLCVRARSAPALSDRHQPLDGRVDERFRHSAAARQCDTMWYTTVMCGLRPRAHWGASASTRSLALIHRYARQRIPTHPKRALAHAAWSAARRSCQEFCTAGSENDYGSVESRLPGAPPDGAQDLSAQTCVCVCLLEKHSRRH